MNQVENNIAEISRTLGHLISHKMIDYEELQLDSDTLSVWAIDRAREFAAISPEEYQGNEVTVGYIDAIDYFTYVKAVKNQWVIMWRSWDNQSREVFPLRKIINLEKTSEVWRTYAGNFVTTAGFGSTPELVLGFADVKGKHLLTLQKGQLIQRNPSDLLVLVNALTF